MSAEDFIGPVEPPEKREERAILGMLPELKEFISPEHARELSPKKANELAEALERKAKISALDSEIGCELLLLASWLPEKDEEAKRHAEVAFERLKELVGKYET